MESDFICECCKSDKAAVMNVWYESKGKTFCGQDCMLEYKAWEENKND